MSVANRPQSAHQDWERATEVLAAGTWTPSKGVGSTASGSLPLMIVSAHGCRSTDTAGRTYIDYMMGWGTNILGYCHPQVESAIKEQLSRGITPSLVSPLEVEVAERLRDLVPCAQRVAFGKNGSDVLGLAVRIARAYTQREHIFVHGYHGVQDWYMATVPQCPGIPSACRSLVSAFRYNDLDSLRDLFQRHPGQVAAVVMEPVQTELPNEGFLNGVQELCRSEGALLIFDEIMTGLRLAPGGAQELFGVTPDLACLAKCLGSGMPLSALVGPERLEEAVGACFWGLTFRGETLSLAAAKATLDVCQQEPVTEHLRRVGDTLRLAFDESTQRLGIEATLRGPSSRMSFDFASHQGIPKRALLTLFVQECLYRGVLHNTHLLPSYSHDDEAVEQTIRVFDQALEVVAQAIVKRDTSGLQMPWIELWIDDETPPEDQPTSPNAESAGVATQKGGLR